MSAFPRALDAPPPQDTPLRRGVEELANAISHGLGAVAALVGGTVLVTLAALRGDVWQLAGGLVFALCLLLLYVASTLYHAARDPVAKARLKVLDHSAIYLLIAGTYTPFTLVGLHGPLGWSLFATIWVLACTGVGFKLFYTGRFKKLSTGIYIAMGWLAIIAIRPMMRILDDATLGWLLAGGLAYTFGTVFYLRTTRFSHAIWHLFCVAGSVCHYVAVARHVASG